MGMLWLYWETPRGDPGTPPYIALCRESVEIRASRHRVTLVTPNNLEEYLPGLPRRLFEIEAEPAGRVDKYFHKRKRRVSAIAQRADFVRAFLLEKYGGFYLDSDAILLTDPEPYFNLLESYDFCVTRRSSFGKAHVSVNFYGSRPGGVVISRYAELLRERLTGPLQYKWNEVGAEMLTPIVDSHQEIVFNIPESEVQPVTFESASEVFTDTSLDLEEVVSRGTKIFMLYRGPFQGPLKDADADVLYGSKMLISQAFRAAIPEEAYREWSIGRSRR